MHLGFFLIEQGCELSEGVSCKVFLGDSILREGTAKAETLRQDHASGSCLLLLKD